MQVKTVFLQLFQKYIFFSYCVYHLLGSKLVIIVACYKTIVNTIKFKHTRFLSATNKNPTQSGGILHLIKILIQYLTNKLWSYKIAYEYAGSGIAVANKFTQNRIDEFGSGRRVCGREAITEIAACEI